MAVFAPKAITSSGERVNGTHLLKMFIVCVSYSNLCFLNVWAEISDRGYDFLRRHSVTWEKVTAVTLDILIVAAFVWGILYLALSSGKPRWIRAVKWGAIVGLALPINVIRTDENFASMQKVYIPNASALQLTLLLLGAAVGLFLLFNWERLSTRVTTFILILLAPTLPLCVASAARHIWAGPPHSSFPNKPLQPPLPQPQDAPHVVWVIFDEWDDSLTFERRPANLSLPEIDRFKREAFHADGVYPPARSTLLSVPSLLVGKTFINSTPEIPSEVMLTYDRDHPPVAITAQSTIFSEARRDGHNIGIVGWYLPYCRLFPDATVCAWFSAIGLSGREEFDHAASISYLMGRTFARQVRKIPLLYYFGIDFKSSFHKTLHAESYENVKNEMLRVVTDPRLNLVYVHMGLPHLPAIYLASTDTISNSRNTTYLDNLRLLDRTIRDLRQTLEAAGLWDKSAILLTADHPLRVLNQPWPEPLQTRLRIEQTAKVPYLLKMPGQSQEFAYTKAMQEVVTKRLLLAILNREVTTPDQVAAWLDRNPPKE